MSIITPQYLAYDSAPLSYTAVSSNDVIYPLTGMTVLHISNASETDDTVVFYPTDAMTPSTSVLVEAGSEVIIGPFDYVEYAPSLTVTHTTTADVYIAAFFSELIITETEIAIATEVADAAFELIITETEIAIATEVADAAFNPDYVNPIITPQEMVAGYTPTYAPVTGSSDVIPLGPATFLHFYNDGTVDDVIVYTASKAGDEGDWGRQVCLLPAGEELLIGPFDMDTYYPELLISHSRPGVVVMAALFFPLAGGCAATATEVWPVESVASVIWPDKTEGTAVWCGL